jgi:TolA-binding protein
MFACLLTVAVMLLLTGCEQPKPKTKTSTKTETAGQQEPAEEAAEPVKDVKPVDVEALPEPEFTLEYCNLRITSTRDDLQDAQDDLADEKEDLKDLQSQPKDADRDSAIASTEMAIRSLTSDVSSLQRGLSSLESKCKKLSAGVCAEFKADANEELADLKNELLKEQKELEYIRDAKKQDLQRRKLLLFERRIAEWTGIVEELDVECK